MLGLGLSQLRLPSGLWGVHCNADPHKQLLPGEVRRHHEELVQLWAAASCGDIHPFFHLSQGSCFLGHA